MQRRRPYFGLGRGATTGQPQSIGAVSGTAPNQIFNFFQIHSRSPGDNATPRNTSPALALRIVLKWPRPSSVGRVESLTRSLTFTSLFGSAPVSPLALIVDVMAKMVTVPSPLCLPAVVGQPPVAGSMELR